MKSVQVFNCPSNTVAHNGYGVGGGPTSSGAAGYIDSVNFANANGAANFADHQGNGAFADMFKAPPVSLAMLTLPSTTISVWENMMQVDDLVRIYRDANSGRVSGNPTDSTKAQANIAAAVAKFG